MTMWLRKMMRKQDGLTLIELIVVVAIIAILAFTITPRVLDALNNSKLNGARSVANEIHSALERYYANQGVSGPETYPQLVPVADNYATLRGLLGDTLALTTNTQSVFAANSFDYVPYSGAMAAGTRLANATTRAVTYCFDFTARDRDTTAFRVTPAGIEEGGAACP